jgi:helicase
MQVSSQPLEWASSAASKFGFPSLNPMQKKAIAEGLLDGGNALVCAPTASGKTLLALLAIAKHFEEKKNGGGGEKGKIVYVVPLRALASEKYDEFSKTFEEKKVGISTGDYDSNPSALYGYDLVVMTCEKLDSVMRHDREFAKTIGLAIVDEIHMLGDDHRGATLEIVLTKLLLAECRLLCLSATVPNASEIGKWLCAKVIKSDYRPTRLELGICDRKNLFFEDAAQPQKLEEKIYLENLCRLALGANEGQGQAIVFVGTRRYAESAAEELSAQLGTTLKAEEKSALAAISKKINSALGHPTSQCAKLAKCVANGVAFHHAGIPDAQRRLIEEGFKRERAIKVIVATTTLAMGVDYPASWVIVRDLKRFDGNFSSLIPALEVKQMVGRAGRPRYDRVGYGILCCNPHDRAGVAEKYIYGELEDIFSQLSSEPVLRVHALALVASNSANSFKQLFEFFQRTFFAHHYGTAEQLFEKVEFVVDDLERMGFLKETTNTALVASPLGKRASELYIDPQTAFDYLKAMKIIDTTNSLSFTATICNSSEMRPFLPVSRAEEQKLWDGLSTFPGDLYPGWEADEQAMAKYKTAKALDAWMSEATEQQMLDEFDLPPGILNARVRIAQWLAYSFSELAEISGNQKAAGRARIYEERIKDGIKEELISICMVRGIGRIRGRKLFDAGIRTKEEYEAAPLDKIKLILGGKASRELAD